MDNKNDGKKTVEQMVTETLNGNSEGGEPSKLDEKTAAGETAATQPTLYTMPDGRELTGEQVLEEYKSLQSDYTRKSQELSEKTKTEQAVNGAEDNKPVLSPRDQAILDDLKNKFGVITKDELDKAFQARKPEIVSESAKVSATQAQLQQALDDLEEDFDGREEDINGVKIPLPKVERQKVIDFIVKNPGTNLSPLEIAKAVYANDFISYEAKKLSANGSAKLPSTEKGGAGVTEPPAAKPLSFRDGSAEEAVKETITNTT